MSEQNQEDDSVRKEKLEGVPTKDARRVARRRAEARAAGLCITCCREHPPRGLAVCESCKESARSRTIRRRVAFRQRTSVQRIVEAHVRAGDEAYTNYLYADAVQHYEDALKVQTIASSDHARISEKLAYALFLGRDPNAARPLFDRALASYGDKPSEASKTVEILLQRVRQLWVDARSEEVLPLFTRALQLCETLDDPYLRKLTYGKLAQYFLGLARLKEAEALLDAVGNVSGDSAAVRATFYVQRAIIAAAFGNATVAFEYFDRAVNAAKEDGDIFYLTCTWNVYGFWALALGRVELAKACDERALLVAREHHVMWRIPDLCLEYAGVLAKIGQQGLAYEYVLNASAYGKLAPTTIMLFASVGIPLALRMKDDAMLSKCAHPSAIDLAFRSGYPAEIGPVTAAFAHLYGVSGRREEAEVLLHRALEALCNVEQVEWIEGFPVAVAQFGLMGDIPKARRFLELRAAYPCSEVANAMLTLFDAFVAQRQGNHTKVLQYATDAAKRFEILGWYGDAYLARTLLPTTTSIPNLAVGESKAFADMLPILTAREQQIAELVLKGLTNRAIADVLSIKERTVETHMTSIMSHLGIRSRHQLVDRLAQD